MRKILVTAAAFIFASMFSFCLAQDQQQDQSAQMKAWQEYMTPGEVHQSMATTAGKWKSHTKFWMNGSDQPMEYDGTADAEMILGGRYLKISEHSVMMNMPFDGLLIQGYDNAKKEFTSIWVDNFGTGFMVMKGKYNPDKNITEFTGTSFDPMSKKDLNYRQTMNVIDSNNMRMEMFLVSDEGETKVMESDYTREE